MDSPTDGHFGRAGRRWGGRKENDMGGSIVCGVDGSADSQAALGVAARLAERLGARLVLAHVAEVPVAPYAAAGGIGASRIAPQPITQEEQEEAGARLLEHIAAEHGLRDADR